MLLTKIYNPHTRRRAALLLMLAASIPYSQSWAAKETDKTAASPDTTSTIKSRLNDTGIIWGGDYPKDINPDCSAEFNLDQIKEFEQLKQLVPGDPVKGDLLTQQDCKHGRDVTANDKRDGAAGFVYRKVGSNGKILDAGAKNWDCVLDEVTGLLWEVKKGPADGKYGSSGLHDSDDLFTWYNPNVKTNGGQLGDWNSQSSQCAGYKAGQPATYCNMEEFAGRVNQQGLCGFKDWRVPTMTELVTLTHYGRSDPAIETGYFPHMQKAHYWSSTPSADVPETAWTLLVQFGETVSLRLTDNKPVILVRNWHPAFEKPAAEAK